MKKLSKLLVCCSVFSAAAQAEVIESSPERYVLKQQMESSLSPSELWKRLVEPSRWWHPDHTYSGDSANLSLDVQAGGLWREDWQGNSVFHGSILQVQTEKLLRLNAPFGPLQGLAVNVVWTINIEPVESGGSLVTFDEVANGSAASKLDALAGAVDFVKNEAIKRLVEP